MLKPSIDRLLEITKSRFVLAVASAKRAHQLDKGEEPLNDEGNAQRNLGIALEEINEGKLTIEGFEE